MLVFVIVQVVGLALFVTISLNYWAEDDIDATSLPLASRLIDPKIHENRDATEWENISGFIEESDEDANYSIQIEVISHSPKLPLPSNGNVNALKSGEGEQTETEPQWMDTGPKNPKVIPTQMILSSIIKSGESSSTVESTSLVGSDIIIDEQESESNQPVFSPENLVARPETEEFIQELQLPKSSLSPEQDIVKHNEDDDDEVKAVLESPLNPDLEPSSTTPMPPSPEAEVVLVKVIKGKHPERKLSHNQLVSVVFQVFLMGFNAVGSFIYVGVLLIHLTTL